MLSIWQTTFCPTCSQWIVGFWQLNEAKFEERVKVTKIFHRSFGKVKFWGWVVSQNVSQIWTRIWFDVRNALVQAYQILWCFQSRIRMTFLVLNSVTGGNQFWLSVANLNMPLWRRVFCEFFTLGSPFRIWSSPISEVSHEIHMLWRWFKLYPSNSRWLLTVWSLGVVEASLTSVLYQSLLDMWV
jgi:hypothetical protein